MFGDVYVSCVSCVSLCVCICLYVYVRVSECKYTYVCGMVGVCDLMCMCVV